MEDSKTLKSEENEKLESIEGVFTKKKKKKKKWEEMKLKMK